MENTKLLHSLIIVLSAFALYLAGRYFIRFFGRKMQIKTRRQESLSHFLLFFSVSITLFFLTFTWGLHIRNIWLFFTSVIGLFGIALFASWSLLSNIVSSFILFFTVPYKIGDHIEIKDHENTVSGLIYDMTLFYVILKDEEGNTVIVPNNYLLQRVTVRRKKRTGGTQTGSSNPEEQEDSVSS